jgi:glycosyltransferase involved in cell wall biosynthesis
MLVSVGIPFYNAEATLGDAIRSVLAQSYAGWELILVNDGSTDGSLEVARSVRDPRVRVVDDGVNRGLIFRLNQIVAMSAGKYIARMDADDLMHPERLERQVAYLTAHPQVDLVGSGVCTIDSETRVMGKRGLGPVSTAPSAVLRRGLVVHPTITGRAEWFRMHPYDPDYLRAEDHELWCRTCTTTRAESLEELLLFYREPVPINLDAYTKSCRTERKIIRRYGPAAVGRLESWVLRAKFAAKPALYRIATLAGMQSRVVARRNAPLSGEERRTLQEVVRRIQHTPVPGLGTAGSCARAE